LGYSLPPLRLRGYFARHPHGRDARVTDDAPCDTGVPPVRAMPARVTVPPFRACD